MYAGGVQAGCRLSTMPMEGEEEDLHFGDSDMVIRLRISEHVNSL